MFSFINNGAYSGNNYVFRAWSVPLSLFFFCDIKQDLEAACGLYRMPPLFYA
jgi:hypothetical protein